MSTHSIGFYQDLTKIELSSNIIKYAPYFFCCVPFIAVSPHNVNMPMQYYRVIALYRRILSRVWISNDASLRASVDIRTRDNIRRYQCHYPFII